MKKVISLIMIVILFLSGCATTKVNINTNVEGAKVTIDGKVIGETPINSTKLKNSSGKEYHVIIEKEGYKTYQGSLRKELNTGAVVSVAIGYSLCFLILPAFLLINALYIERPVPDQYFVLEKTN